MTIRLPLTLALVGIIVGSLGNTTATHACSCAMPGPLSETLAETEAVFAGRVTNIAVDQNRYRQTISFDVSESWKGDVAATANVVTSLDSASCGIDFTPGMEYLVFAQQEDDGDLSTGLCMGTSQLWRAEDDLAELNELTGGSRAPISAETSLPIDNQVASKIAIGVIVFAAGVLFAIRVNRKQK